MHGEKRGERYFSMHRLTGAKLTKLIYLQLVDRDAGHWITAVPALKRRRSLSQVNKAVKQECFSVGPAKLKLYLRLNLTGLGSHGRIGGAALRGRPSNCARKA